LVLVVRHPIISLLGLSVLASGFSSLGLPYAIPLKTLLCQGVLGYLPEELKSRTWQEISYPDDIEATQAEVDALLSGKKASARFTKRYFHKNGAIIWTDVSTALRRDAEGKPLYFLTSVLDITQRKQAEEEIRKLNTELEERVAARTRELEIAQEQLVRQEKLAILGQLAGSVGHELRNPLGVIGNAVFFLRQFQPDADDKVKEYLGIIEAQVHTADKIIHDLLNFGRSNSVILEPVQVSQLVKDALLRFPTPGNVRVVNNLPDNLPELKIDRQQIIQVVGNLLVNAYQAMPSGGEIILSAQQAEMGWLSISVRDHGVGILPENMAKLFEPLFTTKARGMGLGLAVSQKLTEANGGKITAFSEPGAGSTFVITLPIIEELIT
ncbi:MAG: ATP-binding protein, partial [Chloroflexota bacterium]